MTIMLKRCFSTVGRIISSPELVYPSVAAHEYIIDGIQKNGLQNKLMIDPLTKEEASGEQLCSQISRLANKLKSAGVGRGDHVAIVGLNHMNYLPAKFGVMAAGAVPVLFNPTYNDKELSQLMTVSECNYAIGHMCSNSNLAAIKDKHNLTILPHLEIIADWAKEESALLPEFNGTVNDTALMMFSSGTTGLPKSVELTHDNLNSQTASLEAWDTISYYDTASLGTPVIVDFLPEFHAFACILSQYLLRMGYVRVALPIFTPDLYLQALQDYKAVATTLVPPIMLMLAKLDIVPNYDLSSLRLITVGAAPLAPETELAVQKRLEECNPGIDLSIIQGYGCTELGVSSVVKLESASKSGTVGSVVAGQEIKLVCPETGEICGPHRAGEVYARGPHIMKGYYKNPAANAEVFDGEWFKTGDMAYYDDDEDFYIVDRLKEFIKVKGYQVAPAELEGVLILHDDISDAAVIGITSERTGEAPKAYVVRSFGSTLTEQDVKDYVLSNVSDYKQLVEVEFVRSIPRLPSGKIQRRLLRDKHIKERAA